MPEQPAQGSRNHSFVEVFYEIAIGFAQVMLQPSHLVGVVFVIGAFWNSWSIASFGVIGCLAGVLTAFALGFPEQERRAGLYGFNGTLVGLGCAYFYEVSLLLAVLVLVGGAASSVVMNRMLRLGLKPLTFPFVVITWLIFVLLSVTGWATAVPESSVVQKEIVATDSILRGVGQVLFQENIVTGAVFLVAIALRNWTQGIYAAGATLLGLMGASVFGFPADAVNLGLFGYNGVLCAILFAGPRLGDFASMLSAVTFSIVIVRLFHIAELPAFTFPFVLASWLVFWIKGYVTARVAGT